MINKYSQYILDSLAEGVYVVDNEFNLIFVNKAAEKLVGRKRTDYVGTECRNFCVSDQCETACPISEVLENGENIFDLEANYKKVNGDLLPVKVNVSVLTDSEDSPIGGIVSFRDNTREKNFEKLVETNSHYHGIIAKSEKMLDVFQAIEEISDTDTSVLITGETGTGKELVANAIVETSGRTKRPFVKVNCGVLPENLLASELFGHVKGAFTDATKDRVGRFEFADGGTIFLDEIGEMPYNMQSQLLRVLQEGTFERLGESVTRKANVRIIAATNKNLENEIIAKRFREDLYYRLHVIPIDVPPLRERDMDILLLSEFFIRKFNQKYNREIKDIDPDAAEALMNYSWPGNVRQLENAIEYSFIRAKKKDSLCLCCLPPQIRPKQECREKLNVRQIEIDERAEQLLTLLRKNHWNKTKVAKILGINRSTVHRRLQSIQDS